MILHTDTAQLQKYLNLPQRGQVIAEYVWIDATGGTRSKCKVSRSPNHFLPFMRHHCQARATFPNVARCT